MINKIKWWYLQSNLFKYTWWLYRLYGYTKCLFTFHFWVGIMGTNVEVCLRCDKERISND